MPNRKKPNLSRKSFGARSKAAVRSTETPEQRQMRQVDDAARHASQRDSETPDQRNARLADVAARHVAQRDLETPDQRNARLADDAARHASQRDSETPDQRNARLADDAARHASQRASETPDQRNDRLADDAARHASQRDSETPDQRNARLADDAARHSSQRDSETPDQRNARLADDAARHASQRASQTPEDHEETLFNRRQERENFMRMTWDPFRGIAFRYDPNIPYNTHGLLMIGGMTNICRYCSAKKWKKESPGICCSLGKVKLLLLEEPPEPLKSLLTGEFPVSREFLKKVRQYNTCFQMTSFGTSGQIISNNYPTTFTVQGQIYHRLGSMLPTENREHSFLQIYFMGDQHSESSRRCDNIQGLNPDTVYLLQQMLHDNNQLIRTFKVAMDQWPADDLKVIIRADRRPPGEHERRFNPPTTDEIAAVIVGNEFESRDIVLRQRDESLVRVAETHRFYDALQYPLIFWKGQEGYQFNIPQNNPANNQPVLNKNVTSLQFYCFYLMVRNAIFNSVHLYRQLLNQYVVDMFVKIESERLLFIKRNQRKLRAENYIHLQDSIAADGATNPNNLGQVVILPSTFTGSQRYMHEHAQDALAYVRRYGRPDLFITMTCNPKWDEISSELLPGQKATDRHDVVARVFRQKVIKFIAVITKGEIFGSVRCWMYTVEWQKRGLPHIHALIWLTEKIQTNSIDEIIRAEIPDITLDPLLHDTVMKNMVHGPCGNLNPNSPCMKQRKCTKGYPKPLMKETQTNENGYPLYRRRSPDDGGRTADINMTATGNIPVQIDNSWIVPYSPLLSKLFNAHINIELCSSVKSIKYICKYINKGSDQAVFVLHGEGNQHNRRDEVEMYQAGRYVNSNEAFWRIFSFPIQERYPTVTHLSVHLENGQRVYFTDQNMHERIQNPPNTTLTAFFKLCQNDPFAKTLLYCEVPHYFTWNATRKEFQRRLLGVPVENNPDVKYSDAIGRVYTIHPNNLECFCLRILLHTVRGPTSFQDLRTVENITYATYKEACQSLGLLEDDNHWDSTMQEAVLVKSAPLIRQLFAILISSCGLINPLNLWEKYKSEMAEDILHFHRAAHPHLEENDLIVNEVLIDLQQRVFTMCGKELSAFGLPRPQTDLQANSEILREKSYEPDELERCVQEMTPKLLPEQQIVVDIVLQKITNQESAVYFLDAPGGTGKTFVITLLLAHIRKNNDIALAIASSGIAATLLPGGRTAHSVFKLPLNLSNAESATCNITKDSERAALLQQCKLLVWDECTMSHKRALEALNQTLQDLRGNHLLMGGMVVLLAGDFRQTLPVVQKGNPADEINACLKSSVLWSQVTKLHLTKNMRVHLFNDVDSAQFALDLLKIGEGRVPADVHQMISLPHNFCHFVSSTEELISSVFPNVVVNCNSTDWLCERAILCPKNELVNSINNKVMNFLPGENITFKSVDSIMDDDQAVNYPAEFLNSLEVSGIPPHELRLKVGVPVMLMRNLDAPKLCNGTRLVIKSIGRNTVQASILTGSAKGENVIIPKIPIIPTDLPFKFKRLQFPLRVAFAMTINKSQGQTLKVAGLQLEKQCFSHGQLYVACSRVSSGKNLFIYSAMGKVTNVVHKNVLH